MSYIPFPDITPEIFTLELGAFSFALRWYAVSYIAGILIAWWIAYKAITTPKLWALSSPPMTPAQLERFITWIVLGVILGGRLGFVLFYNAGYYLSHPLDIFKIWQGGMSFHGGFLGVVIGAIVFCWREKLPYISVGDFMALSTPPGLMLVRIANFINAELWGRPTDLPWGVAFPGSLAQSCATADHPCVRHPSQIYEALLEGLLLALVMLFLAWGLRWLRYPGRIMGVFLAAYALARFMVEFFRQPDAQFISENNPIGLAFHINGYGLTMGQSLSIPMGVVGIYFIWRSHKTRQISGA